MMRDIAYEQALLRHRRKMQRILEEYSRENPAQWSERDFLAIQRALQVYIESFIGMVRYFVQQKYQLSVSQSREALDELKSCGDLTPQQHEELMRIIGFRNILAHDYLDVDDRIVREVLDELKSRGDLSRQQYEELMKIIGFRNILVHDYLDVDDRIVEAVITNRGYAVLEQRLVEWQQILELLP